MILAANEREWTQILIRVYLRSFAASKLGSVPSDMLVAPGSDGLDNRPHGFSVTGNAVLHARRDFRVDRPAD